MTSIAAELARTQLAANPLHHVRLPFPALRRVHGHDDGLAPEIHPKTDLVGRLVVQAF